MSYCINTHMRPIRLVEQRTVQHMCSVRDNLSRKSNGENMIRMILLALGFFILFQMATRPQEEKEEKTPTMFPLTAPKLDP